jgi:hypothetical protein
MKKKRRRRRRKRKGGGGGKRRLGEERLGGRGRREGVFEENIERITRRKGREGGIEGRGGENEPEENEEEEEKERRGGERRIKQKNPYVEDTWDKLKTSKLNSATREGDKIMMIQITDRLTATHE